MITRKGRKMAAIIPVELYMLLESVLEEFEYKNQTVMVAPASGFYSTPGYGKNEVRIAYVLKIEDLKNAMETLAEALKVYPGRI